MEEKKRRNERGITRIVLIALIVCVIILLILGVVLIQKLSRKQSEAGNKEKTANVTKNVVQEEAKQDEECISAYADIDNDGTVDGIIYADLTVGGSGVWNPSGNPDFDPYGEFTIPKETSKFREYYVSQKSYTGDFGTGKVVSPVDGTSGRERFYVMALDDVDTDVHCWYASAYDSKISKYSSVTLEGFGSGNVNTGRMIDAWNNETYGQQNTMYITDMWGLADVQNKYNSEPQWFVPSRKEWAAFGYNLQIDRSDYSSKGLSDDYWSSSLYRSDYVWGTNYYNGYMGWTNINNTLHVRLGVTF